MNNYSAKEKAITTLTANIQNAMWRRYQDPEKGSQEPFYVIYNFLANEIINFTAKYGADEIPPVKYGYYTEAPYDSDIDYSQVTVTVDDEHRITLRDDSKGFLETWDPNSPRKEIINT